ncbi:hypothetical protein KKF38_02040 [Patescibacteria group bacterium]|nr:hypothetical protein [Patescibacteria group bacterium]
MNENIRDSLTKKSANPFRRLWNRFFSANDSDTPNEIQNFSVEIPDDPIQLLRGRLGVLNNSHKKGVNVKENLRCFEEKLIELKETRLEIREGIESLLRDTRKSLAEKYGDGSKD